jgi:hypothetical protein
MRRNLNEQIQAFRKLTGLLLNEGPGELLTRLISKLTKVSLEDAAITAFEGLEKKGLLTIDKASKTIKTINWPALADADLKLLFKSRTVRTMFEEAAKESGVDITNAVMTRSLGGNFKKLLNGYKQAESEGLFDSGKTFFKKPDVTPTVTPTSSAVPPPPEVAKVMDKKMSDYVSNKLKLSEVRNVTDEDITKMANLQGLKQNGEAVKMAENATKHQKEVNTIELKIKSLDAKEKELDIAIKKNSSDVDLKMKKTQLANEKLTLNTRRIQLIWKAKWYIIGVLVLVLGWKKIVPLIEKIAKGQPIFSGGNSAPTTGTNTPTTTPPPPTTKEKINW